jgi:hypothetical protein
VVVDSLKALDHNRPIREADMSDSRLLPCKLTPEPHFAVPESEAAPLWQAALADACLSIGLGHTPGVAARYP